ncbi:MAG: penicillin-binding protein [Bacteriovoracaceae bacterium]
MESFNKKLKAITIIFGVLFVGVISRAFWLQVIDRENLLKRYEKQVFRERKVYPKRGNIYDRDGNPLAINIKTYSLFVIPSQLSKISELKVLSKFIPKFNYRKFSKKIKDRNRFTWVARKVELNNDQVKLISNIKGLHFEEVPKRFYPNQQLASQILGFVGVDNKGLAGVEHHFNKELLGGPKLIKFLKDAKGRPVKFEVDDPGVDAKDLTLTISKDLQIVAERFLEEAVIEHGAINGGIGVMDAESGEILAMANYPSFNPNNIKKESLKYNRLSFVTDPVEPGSTLKTLTIISALENNIAKPDTSYYCEQGRMVIDGHIVNEAESQKKYEWLSMREILKYSSNVGTTKIAFDLGQDKLVDTFKKYGLGKKTGVSLPGESRGIFETDKKLSDIKLSNISFGQGIAVNGLQILSSYAAIANGGYLVRPKILMNEKTEKVKVLEKENADKLTDMLVEAVESGTGSKAKINHFKIAGKTSTAQRPDSRGSYEGHIPGFVGYSVNVKKKFVIYVYVEKPDSKIYYGNAIAAPIFKKVAEYILFKNKDIQNIKLSKVIKESKKEKTKIAKKPKRKSDNVRLRSSSRLKVIKGVMPSFIGLTKRSVLEISKKHNLKVYYKGKGVVTRQDPKPGASINASTSISLKLEVPRYDN